MPETIYLKPLTAWERAQKTRAKLPAPLRLLTSLKTTAVLGATLGTLLYPTAALGAVKGAARFVVKRPLTAAITIPTAATVLYKSKKARKVVKTALDPRETVKRGEKIAELIEDPKKASDILGIKDLPLKEKVIKGLKAAGWVGAAAAVAVGGVAALKKGKELLAERALKKVAAPPMQLDPGLRSMGFTDPQPVGLGGVPISQPLRMPTGAPGELQKVPPVSNIIQIQVS